jgi:DNA repair protein RadC
MRIVMEEAGTEYRVAKERRIRTPEDAAGAAAMLRGLEQEVFGVLCLDAKNGLKVSELATVGILDASLVHPREVFRIAIRANAASVVLVHNHPSGDPTPSAEDVRLTRQLVEAGKIIDIAIVDHVIIGKPDETGRGGWVSMREAGLCNFTA